MKTSNHIVLMMGILVPLVRGQDQAELDKLLTRLNEITVDSSVLNKLQQYGGPQVWRRFGPPLRRTKKNGRAMTPAQ